jgi:hypothetical protein
MHILYTHAYIQCLGRRQLRTHKTHIQHDIYTNFEFQGLIQNQTLTIYMYAHTYTHIKTAHKHTSKDTSTKHTYAGEVCPHMIDLDLSANKLTEAGAFALMQAIRDCPSVFPSMRTLGVGGHDQIKGESEEWEQCVDQLKARDTPLEVIWQVRVCVCLRVCLCVCVNVCMYVCGRGTLPWKLSGRCVLCVFV